jgi:hypothetical protein
MGCAAGMLAEALHENALFQEDGLTDLLVFCMSGHNALVCELRFLAC